MVGGGHHNMRNCVKSVAAFGKLKTTALNKQACRASEMDQQLAAPAAPPGDQSSIPSTHMPITLRNSSCATVTTVLRNLVPSSFCGYKAHKSYTDIHVM